MSKKKVNKCKWGEKTYKTCFFALSLTFLYNVGKLERRFYKAKNGEFPLDPQMQEALLEVFKKRGADISLGFDSYEDQDVLVEK